jgi:hypothetical protein
MFMLKYSYNMRIGKLDVILCERLMGEGIFCFTETPFIYFMGREGSIP